jgi:hypothetical protein
MKKRMQAAMRYLVPLTTTGILLQTGGCAFQSQELVGAVANSVLTNVIFGFFGLV